MNYEEVRLRCVELMLKYGGGYQQDFTIDAARKLADFVLGANDSEIIGAARDFAKQVNAATT